MSDAIDTPQPVDSPHLPEKPAVPPLRVCFFGTYRAEYVRNQAMIARLRSAHVEVVECHAQLWRDDADRLQTARGGWLHPAFWRRLVSTYLGLVRHYVRVGEYDILFVGYPGPLDVYLARLLSWFRRKPLVWDILMSLYLITLERGLGKEHPVSVRLLRAIEKTACHLPDQLIIDTQEYVQWFVENYHIPAERFLLAPLGADDRFFQPLPHQPRDQPSFLVVYHGTFVPSHGVTTIIEAARLLQEDADILFELIGAGPELEIAQALAKAYRLENVTFSGWLEKERLVQELAQADVCLGTFGATRHSLLTIQNKVYESMAMAKPVITGDGPAIRRAFTDTEDGQRMPKHRQSEQVPGETCYAVERANPQALAQAIAHLKANPKLRQTLAQNGYNAFRQRYSIACLGAQLKEQLRGLSD